MSISRLSKAFAGRENSYANGLFLSPEIFEEACAEHKPALVRRSKSLSSRGTIDENYERKQKSTRRRTGSFAERGSSFASRYKPADVPRNNSFERSNLLAPHEKFLEDYFVIQNTNSSHMKTAAEFTEEELKQFCRYFWRSDINGSGKLTVYDFSKLVEHLGMKLTKEEIKQAFKVADVDEDGSISFNDFTCTYLNKHIYTSISPEKIKDFFSKSNSTDRISLSKDECFQVLKMLGNDAGDKKYERVMRLMGKDNADKVTLRKLYSFLGQNL